MRDKTALITGASSGIGRELAKVFAQEGWSCVLTARSEDKLKQLAQEIKEAHEVSAMVIAKDLARPEAPQELFDALQQERVQVDALINNAGFATYGLFWEIEAQRDMDQVQVNVAAPTHLTKLFLPAMTDRRKGWIMMVSSTAAFLPGPLMAVYYATKAYDLHLAEALANELQGTGVTVTALCPGVTRSGFQERAGLGNARFLQGKMMEASQVARIGYDGMIRGKTVVIPGFANRLAAWLALHSPKSLVIRGARWAQEPADEE